MAITIAFLKDFTLEFTACTSHDGVVGKGEDDFAYLFNCTTVGRTSD